MIKKSLIILFVLSVFISHAQVAGYMGKRFVIGYSNYFMFGIKGPGPINGGSSNEASPTLNNANC